MAAPILIRVSRRTVKRIGGRKLALQVVLLAAPALGSKHDTDKGTDALFPQPVNAVTVHT